MIAFQALMSNGTFYNDVSRLSILHSCTVIETESHYTLWSELNQECTLMEAQKYTDAVLFAV